MLSSSLHTHFSAADVFHCASYWVRFMGVYWTDTHTKEGKHVAHLH